MEELIKLHEILRDYIKPLTTPVAVKLTNECLEPSRAKKPTEYFGYPLALCQGFSFARKYGWSMIFDKEDMACGPSISYFGFVEIPEFEAQGGLVYPMYAKLLDAGKKSEDIIDKFTVGKYKRIIITPLDRTELEPDVILVYCNAAQIARLVQGAVYCEGGGIKTTIAGRCACTSEVITPMLSDDYNVIVPDGGERVFALTSDDEMVFSIPYLKIKNLIEGIVTTHKSGVARYPYPVHGLRMKPKFPELYDEIVNLVNE